MNLMMSITFLSLSILNIISVTLLYVHNSAGRTAHLTAYCSFPTDKYVVLLCARRQNVIKKYKLTSDLFLRDHFWNMLMINNISYATNIISYV